MKNEININEEKILLAFKNNIKLHLSLKDKTFRNCFIEKIEKDYFIIKDDINGNETLFFLEIYNAEPYYNNLKEGDKDEL